MLRAILLVVLFRSAAFEGITNIKVLKQTYETSRNSSIHLDRGDRVLMGTWMVDFQVKRVNVTTKYRMQMTRHTEHSFEKADYNAKWTECVFLHRRQIRKLTREYYADESECLTTITIEDKDRTGAVEQIEKECRKWRRSYRYLVRTCNAENPGDDEAADVCLVQNMVRDHFDKVIQRLIILKLEAMGQLYIQLNNSIRDLEECLKTQLSSYLEKVRKIMDTLNNCYNLTTRVSEKRK